MRASDPPSKRNAAAGVEPSADAGGAQLRALVMAMRGFVDQPDLDPERLLAIQALLLEAVRTSIATRARSYSSLASSSFASSHRKLASSRGKLPLSEEQLDEVVARFRATTGRAEVSKALRGLLAARARDVGDRELVRRFELRFAARKDSENLLTGIERDDWDADLPTRSEHRLGAAPTFDGDLPDGPAPAPTDDRPFAERMAAHDLRREDL